MFFLPVVAFIAGLCGTAATHLFLFALARAQLVESRLAVKLGALVLRREEGVSHMGILLHYIFGALFGLIYVNLVVLAEPESVAGVFLLCLVLGLAHGTLAALALLRFARLHPLPPFREASVSVAVAYGAAHLIYGMVVALVLLAFAAV